MNSEQTEVIDEYERFIKNNKIKVNGYLNKVLWFFVITGPAIATGVFGGVFNDISYTTCLLISLIVIALSLIHLVLLKKAPHSIVTCLFALTALDGLLVYMTYAHVSIYLTWFLVPLLSLLFVDKFIYFYSAALNYILMGIATWLTAPYYTALRGDYDNQIAYFRDTFGGFTIETLIMMASSYMIGKLIDDYFKEQFNQYAIIRKQDEIMREKMEILDSMAEIYDNVNLINFIDNTEMPLRDAEQKKHGIDMTTQTHTLMNQRIKNQVMPDQFDDFMTFTNIKTVRSRLAGKKLISADFIDIAKGWFRAQYITVDSTLDGIPNVIIFTTRNVDEEKRREEHLIRLSMTDEMTRLYNRRCYEEDLEIYRKKDLEDDFVLFSIDVNGLKVVNDTKGHSAGDELIKGAADCLAFTVGNRGKVYRTGGDEFMAILHTDDAESIRIQIIQKASEWHGMYTDKLTMSVGYASHKDNPDLRIDDIEHKADSDMYSEKDKYYRENNINRRR